MCILVDNDAANLHVLIVRGKRRTRRVSVLLSVCLSR